MLEPFRTLIVLCAVVFPSACDSGIGSNIDATDAPHVADQVPWTGPQIVGVIKAVNDSEIEQALLALGEPNGGIDGGPPLDSAFGGRLGRSANGAVVMFAKTMLADHAQSNATIGAFGIVPATSSERAALADTAQANVAQLFPLLGRDFDIAYVQTRVAAHTEMRELLENRLIPEARNAQLKTYLSGTLLPVVETHLAVAQALFALLTNVRSLDAAADPEPQ
jgi:putative membrane protein